MCFKYLRKQICAALAISTVLAGSAKVYAEGAFEVQADKDSLSYGETTEISVEFPGGGVYNGAEVTVSFSEDMLTLRSVETGDLYDNAFMNSKKSTASKSTVMAIYSTNLDTGGTLAVFSFEALADITAETYVDFNIQATDQSLGEYNFDYKVKLNIKGGERTQDNKAPDAEATAKPSTGGSGGTSSAGTAAPSPTTAAEPQATEAASAAPDAADEKAAVHFKDTTGHWARESIEHLASIGYVNGFDEDTFAPEQNVTRAEFVKMLTKACHAAAEEYEDTFKDISASDWYAPYIAAAYNAGIVQGDDNGNFNPDANITRQEMAVMAARAFDKKDGGEPDFADKNEIAMWARDAVKALAEDGIITGFSEDNTFRPADNTTRAQAAVVIERLVN